MHAGAQHAYAQQRDTSRVRPDSAVVPAGISPIDSARLALADSLEEAQRRADTIKAPLPRAELPMSLGPSTPWRWDRDALDASGAITLADLLERIPGIVTFRAGWISSPQLASYVGDPTALRLFIDGIEIAPLSARGPGFDLAEFALWPLEEVVVERGASEVRVHMRTWSVRNTTPYTRTDVYTGNEDTNVYRGFFGRRFARGEALQVAGEQYGTSGQRFGRGDQLALLARVGIGRSRWAADAFVIRSNRTRQDFESIIDDSRLFPLTARATTAYVRASTGSVDAGPWLQLIAASQAHRETSPQRTTTPVDTADTTRSVSDWIATGGMTWSRLRVSALARARVGNGETRWAQSARLGATLGPLSLQGLAENGMVDSTMRVDASAQLRLFGPLYAMGAAEYTWDRHDAPFNEESYGVRGELGLQIGRLWLSGGAIYRDTMALAPPGLFESGYVPVFENEAIGGIATARGKVWRDVGVDATFVTWETEGWYRPQHHAIGRVFVDTRWLTRFPSGNFVFRAWVEGEYRSEVPFPTEEGPEYSTETKLLSFLVEIRIVDAVLTWQLRNAAALRQSQVPGWIYPGPIQFYGVRWHFWN